MSILASMREETIDTIIENEYSEGQENIPTRNDSSGEPSSESETDDDLTELPKKRAIASTEIHSSKHIEVLKRKSGARLSRLSLTTRNMSFCGPNVFVEKRGCTRLYHTKRSILPLKNYHDEARALKDIEKFLDHPVVLFKVRHTSWEAIVREMIKALDQEKPELKLNIQACVKQFTSEDTEYTVPESIRAITDTQNGPYTEKSFVTVLGKVSSLNDVQVVIALLAKPFNFGRSTEEIRFICIILSGEKGKHTKSGIEVGRSYATLLADEKMRASLINSTTASQFASKFELEVHRIHKEHEVQEREIHRKVTVKNLQLKDEEMLQELDSCRFIVGRDLVNDVKRRIKFYVSDYIEDLKSCTSIQKMISATLFLYFSLLLPGIAFGILNAYYTEGKIDSKNVVVSQALGGLLFSVYGGQPLVVVRTTIPVVIYTKIIYTISKNWDEDGDFFYTFYAMTGIANAFFLILYALTGASKIMRYCSRSTEEIVGLFISTAFVVDSVKYIAKEFDHYYCFNEAQESNSTVKDISKRGVTEIAHECDPMKPILTLLIIFITVFVGVQIYNFKNSPFLNTSKRVLVASYALLFAVVAGSFVGSYAFRQIQMKKFLVNETRSAFDFVEFAHPPVAAVFTSIALGFVMSILFFMEGNVSASLVNNPANNLKKGSAFHLDMFTTGFINLILSLYALPWIHGALPHSPLHVRALADIDEHTVDGHVTEKVNYVRETRLTTMFASILIGASVLMIPYPLDLIPIPVFYGIFLYLAITSLEEFQMWERLVLIFTEQNLYPPIHYVRRVPQKIIHCFTLLQLVQLAVLCAISFGGSAYLKMFFPFVILMLMPIRERLIPKFISEKHLNVLDGLH